MVTVHDVARRAGVSIATVSRALNGRDRISAETRQRVLDVARELGYQPNDLARSLAGKATQTIALLLPDITNPFFPELVKGVQTVVDERGHLLLMCRNADDEEKAIADLNLLRRRKVDGILLVNGALPGGTGLAAATAELPTVMVDRPVPGLEVDLVTVDHRRGARKAVEHLVGLGHRRIAHLAGPHQITNSRDRQAGWTEALRAAGLPPDPDLVAETDFSEDGGYEAGRDLLARDAGFTAVFAANDLSAIGLLTALTEAGLRVPADISIVGFDGLHLTAYTTPQLTTVAQPIFTLGQRAAELLLDRLVAPPADPATTRVRNFILDTELIIRGSTGPVITS